MNPSVFTLKQGHAPLLISIPHCGEMLPPGLAARFSPQAKRIPDTDWHLPRLYHDLAERLGASVLQANYSRYVIDLNRSCDDSSSLYPGQKTTTLCPTITFLDESIYTQEDDEPNEVEIASRIEQYWKPYHDALDKEINRLLERHGQVLVWEAHSIKSELPMLFDGVLTTLNLANNDGRASSPEVLDAAVNVAKHSGLTWSDNGRFKGGFITRNYAIPEKGIHFIQLEMGRCAYMDEDEPWGWRDEPATRTANMLYEMVSEALSALTDQTTDERLKIEVGKSDIRTN